MQHLRVPGDILRIIAKEIADFEAFPEIRISGGGDAGQVQQSSGFSVSRIEALVGAADFAAQQATGQPIEVFEQFALPGIPDQWTGAPDVGHGQQVQRRESPLRADSSREAGNRLGVAQVLLLRNLRHGQVLIDQKLDQIAVFD